MKDYYRGINHVFCVKFRGRLARMYTRILDLREIVSKRSVFFLGPRQTGKSTLVRTQFPGARYVDLLEADTFRELSAYPETLRQSLTDEDRIIIIDEVQKLPGILDEVHTMMERNKSLRFVLTGSSARKLKSGAANLLGGRAWLARLHPLVSEETGHSRFLRRLSHGSLPAVIDSEFPIEDLKAYVGTYLQEEIRAEGLARSIESFSRFLDVAGICNGEQLNYTKVGNDTGIPPRTVRDHFQILEDTLIGHTLPPFRKTGRRKAVATSKFYFFDVGVANLLLKRGRVEPGSESFGRALEHLVFLELKAFLSYRRLDTDLSFWRTQRGYEVDFLLDESVAIEVKGTGRVSDSDLKGIRALKEELPLKRMIVVCSERAARKTADGIELMPAEEFLRMLWAGGLTPTID